MTKKPITKRMANILTMFRDSFASAEDKLLKKHYIEDPIGVPTEEGLRLATELLYKEKREEIIKLVQKLDDEAEKKAKK